MLRSQRAPNEFLSGEAGKTWPRELASRNSTTAHRSIDMRQHLVAAAVAAALGFLAQSAHADDATTVGGRMYADFSNISQDKNGKTTDADGTGFDVKRFYLIIDHKFDDIWSANLTTNFNYVSNDGQTQVFVKKAYVQAKLDDYFIARGGSADMPVDSVCRRLVRLSLHRPNTDRSPALRQLRRLGPARTVGDQRHVQLRCVRGERRRLQESFAQLRHGLRGTRGLPADRWPDARRWWLFR